jgi:hypothetical protein
MDNNKSLETVRVSGPGLGPTPGQGAIEKLPGDQRAALESLLQGNSVVESARLAGVSRGTVYYWLKSDPAFLAAFNQWNDEMQQSARSRLMMMTDKAVKAVEKALENGDARAAVQLLKGMGLIASKPTGSGDPDVVKREMDIEKRKGETKLFYDELKLTEMGG